MLPDTSPNHASTTPNLQNSDTNYSILHCSAASRDANNYSEIEASAISQPYDTTRFRMQPRVLQSMDMYSSLAASDVHTSVSQKEQKKHEYENFDISQLEIELKLSSVMK